jgi:RNA polymerase sigma factor (sigma-70 family)
LTDAIAINGFLPAAGNSVAKEGELYLLVKDCIAKSRSAQKKLYDIYSPAAYGIIRRYMYSNEQAAKEILNDSFFKIFTKLEQYSFQGAFEGWIRRIVVNTITDYLRKNIKEEQYHKEVDADDGYVDSSPVENLSYKELLQLVQTLPEAQLAVFNLFVFENYAHKEIAKLLNINENNSRWYLNDARRRLREKIQTTITT